MSRRWRLIESGDEPRNRSVHQRIRHDRGAAGRAPGALSPRRTQPTGKPALPVAAGPPSRSWGYLWVRRPLVPDGDRSKATSSFVAIDRASCPDYPGTATSARWVAWMSVPSTASRPCFWRRSSTGRKAASRSSRGASGPSAGLSTRLGSAIPRYDASGNATRASCAASAAHRPAPACPLICPMLGAHLWRGTLPSADCEQIACDSPLRS